MDDDKEYKLSIRSAGNTQVPCLQVIYSKGYILSHYYLNNTPGEWKAPQWDAEKNGRRFSATSLEELLGLIAMWEIRGDDWRHKNGEQELYDQLIESAPMYDSEGNIIDN
ncbi:hypothetical protein [Acaryochloris sp. CCMEE 5410]|uniref:hypothetical protein n=1 Tax=Acaryochloris sp. CCMEE 5410 TaxID=310037 RepID=UPI0002484B98|nr:hypothetical protein [Acaryochloris sp. CCMEE 5410]KAI9132947.1 hypothetical protein ON05_006080 [Acaryochloris sp. CCMEE 5410]